MWLVGCSVESGGAVCDKVRIIMSYPPANIVHVDKFSKPGYHGRHTSYADGMKDTADVSWFHILSPMYLRGCYASSLMP